ncbi:hypothetical protein AU387_00025 [Bacillus halotolerans]|nr:hypothetical protein AU387_00025 [Bacillus halotolerans]
MYYSYQGFSKVIRLCYHPQDLTDEHRPGINVQAVKTILVSDPDMMYHGKWLKYVEPLFLQHLSLHIGLKFIMILFV